MYIHYGIIQYRKFQLLRVLTGMLSMISLFPAPCILDTFSLWHRFFCQNGTVWLGFNVNYQRHLTCMKVHFREWSILGQPSPQIRIHLFFDGLLKKNSTLFLCWWRGGGNKFLTSRDVQNIVDCTDRSFKCYTNFEKPYLKKFLRP